MSLRRLFILGLSLPIRFYRVFLSPLTPPACRFHPTCSAYALEAIQSHGPLQGFLLAVRRLCRCHPISFLGGASGLDPVPRHQKRGTP